MSRRRAGPRADALFVVGTLAAAMGAGTTMARSSTPDHSSISPGGAAATWAGPALTGNPEPLGPPAEVCSQPAGCDRTAITLVAPPHFADTNVITVSVTLTWSDSNSNFDVGLLDSNLALLGARDSISSGDTLTVDNVNPGDLVVEVDGDVAINAAYSGTISATSVPRKPQHAQPAGSLTFSRETVADPFRLGTEPSVIVGPHGTVYEAPILGFETSQSFIDRSEDGGATFNTLGVPGEGKLSACPEGGDIAMTTDANDTLWFAGLSGGPTTPVGVSPDRGNTIVANCLANVAGTEYFADRPWLTTDPVHGVELLFFRNGLPLLPDNAIADSFAGHSYGELIKVAPLPASGTAAGPTQLTFASLCKTVSGIDDTCFGGLGFAGMPVTDTHSSHAGTTYLPINYGFTDAHGNGHNAVGLAVVDPTRSPPVILRPAAIDTYSVLFPSIAVDRAGNLYEVWHDPSTFQVMFSASADQGQTWTPPAVINGAPAAQTAMPTAVAGDAGRVDIAFYGSPNHAPPPGNYGPWNVYLLQSLDANSASPHWTQSIASDHPAHVDPVCLAGTACLFSTGPGGDRALGDFMQVNLDGSGRALISFADGNNRLGDEAAGQRASEPSFDELVRQASGPSLFKPVGTVPPIDVPANSVTVAPHANHIPFVSPAGPGPSDAALELLGSSTSVGVDGHGMPLVSIHMVVGNLDVTAATSPPASPVATYLTRWWFAGQVYFAAAELSAGQWHFFAGHGAPANPGPLVKLAAYPATTTVTGAVVAGPRGTVDITVPASAIGNPTSADMLYSVTSYALTHLSQTPSTVPASQTSANDVPQIADSLPAYNVIPGPATRVPEFPVGVVSIGLLLVVMTLVGVRHRRHARPAAR